MNEECILADKKNEKLCLKVVKGFYKVYKSYCVLDTGPRRHIPVFPCEVSLCNFTGRLPYKNVSEPDQGAASGSKCSIFLIHADTLNLSCS